ncbi:MAG: hypothetical protein GY791_07600 [Alphaproteobacteria bacterium]|nr:hypothetical protein [Alphaproteobacteria bacterium]
MRTKHFGAMPVIEPCPAPFHDQGVGISPAQEWIPPQAIYHGPDQTGPGPGFPYRRILKVLDDTLADEDFFENVLAERWPIIHALDSAFE